VTKFPIALRSFNRPVFLDTTYRSLKSSDIPEGVPLIVIDDCSENFIAKKHIFTNSEIVLEQVFKWPTYPGWLSGVGKIKPLKGLHGIKDEVEVVQPSERKGDLGGIFWIIDYMMSRFKDSECIIVFEADCVVRKDWYEVIEKSYHECKHSIGPNGDRLGLLTCYNRSATFGKSHKYELPGWRWGSVTEKISGNWNCGSGIGGVMYLVTRQLYEASISAMKASYKQTGRSGDTAIQAQCGIHKLNIASTSPSYCQHIGFESICWPNKGWRHSRCFKDFCFEKFDEDGWAYSDKWII
jgi:hypothetical protein